MPPPKPRNRKSSASDSEHRRRRQEGDQARGQGRDRLDVPGPVPRHVAIIMDGNGRWAAAQGLPRVAGHRAGAEAVRRTLRAAVEAGVEVLTLYAFSSENWRRSDEEVVDLTGLLRYYVDRELETLEKEGVQLRLIGDPAAFGQDLEARLERAVERTKDNDRLTLVVALNYGSRGEIAAAARDLARQAVEGRIDAASIDEAGDRRAIADARLSRARPAHPHFGRNAAVQLPVVASGLCRARLRRDAVAGFRRSRVRSRAWPICSRQRRFGGR